MPPNFGDLPTPTEESDNVVESEDENIKKILSKKKSSNYNEEASAAESLILEELNSN